MLYFINSTYNQQDTFNLSFNRHISSFIPKFAYISIRILVLNFQKIKSNFFMSLNSFLILTRMTKNWTTSNMKIYSSNFWTSLFQLVNNLPTITNRSAFTKSGTLPQPEDLTFQTDNFEKVWKSARRQEAQGRRVWRLIKLTVVDKLQLPSQGITHRPIESFFYTATKVLSKSSTSTTTL